jgi:hypothetical protein
MRAIKIFPGLFTEPEARSLYMSQFIQLGNLISLGN